MAEKIRVPKWDMFKVQLKGEKVKRGQEEYVYLPTMVSIYHPNKNSGIRHINSEIKLVKNYTIEINGNTIYETMTFDNCDYTQGTILDNNGENCDFRMIFMNQKKKIFDLRFFNDSDLDEETIKEYLKTYEVKKHLKKFSHTETSIYNEDYSLKFNTPENKSIVMSILRSRF